MKKKTDFKNGNIYRGIKDVMQGIKVLSYSMEKYMMVNGLKRRHGKGRFISITKNMEISEK